MPNSHRLYLFDADGTLRRCKDPSKPCPNNPDEWELIPGVRERLATIDWGASFAGIVSNQGGVGLGFMTYEVARRMLCDTIDAATGVPIDPYWPILMCPHTPKDGCVCRKPNPYLICIAMASLDIKLTREVLYVGDQDTDKQAADRAGVEFMFAKDFFGW